MPPAMVNVGVGSRASVHERRGESSIEKMQVHFHTYKRDNPELVTSQVPLKGEGFLRGHGGDMTAPPRRSFASLSKGIYGRSGSFPGHMPRARL